MIGKGGAIIQNVRQQSGATIDIHDPEKGSLEREVVVVGTEQQCQMATQMIQQRVAEAPAPQTRAEAETESAAASTRAPPSSERLVGADAAPTPAHCSRVWRTHRRLRGCAGAPLCPGRPMPRVRTLATWLRARRAGGAPRKAIR